jgi:hypothetical protein
MIPCPSKCRGDAPAGIRRQDAECHGSARAGGGDDAERDVPDGPLEIDP